MEKSRPVDLAVGSPIGETRCKEGGQSARAAVAGTLKRFGIGKR